MSPRDLQACEMFQPAERACWEILLREYSDMQHIPDDVLSRAMDTTFQQLWAILRTASVESWLKAQENLPPLPPVDDCALNVLLPYFNAGRHALDLIAKELDQTAPEIPEAERSRVAEELCSAFNLLVHWQLQGACNRCRQAGQCPLSGSRNPRVRAASSVTTVVTSVPAEPEAVNTEKRTTRKTKLAVRGQPRAKAKTDCRVTPSSAVESAPARREHAAAQG